MIKKTQKKQVKKETVDTRKLIKYCNHKLKNNGYIQIDGKYLYRCKHKHILNLYKEVFEIDPIEDFNKIQKQIKEQEEFAYTENLKHSTVKTGPVIDRIKTTRKSKEIEKRKTSYFKSVVIPYEDKALHKRYEAIKKRQEEYERSL